MKSVYRISLLLFVICSTIFGFLAWQDSKQASVKLVWTTASEVDTAGFNIYRSESSDDGFILINADIIPAAQDALIGAAYSFIDNDVSPGKTYYYQLEDIAMNGQVHRDDQIEVTARADYWLNLSISMLFIGLAMFIVLNKRWLFESYPRTKHD